MFIKSGSNQVAVSFSLGEVPASLVVLGFSFVDKVNSVVKDLPTDEHMSVFCSCMQHV